MAALAEHGDEAKPLAGGQSLIPAMNFRLAQPSVLVDLELVEALRPSAVRTACSASDPWSGNGLPSGRSRSAMFARC